MQRSASGPTAAAVVVALIGGVAILLLLGCGGLGALALFSVRSPGPPMTAASPVPASTAQVEAFSASPLTITNNAAGEAMFDGQAYADDILRERLLSAAADDQRVSFTTQFSADLPDDRRAAIEQVVAEVNGALQSAAPESTPSTDLPPE